MVLSPSHASLGHQAEALRDIWWYCSDVVAQELRDSYSRMRGMTNNISLIQSRMTGYEDGAVKATRCIAQVHGELNARVEDLAATAQAAFTRCRVEEDLRVRRLEGECSTAFTKVEGLLHAMRDFGAF